METTELKPTETTWDLREGDEIAANRTAIKLLGGGFRYEAYLAWDEHLRSFVVCKVVRPGLVEDEGTLRGIREEAEALDALDHPAIVRSFGLHLEAEKPHLVLEHLEGPRMSSLLRKYGTLPLEQLVPLAVEVCAAVHYMGREGWVHFDVKPSNVIMGGPPRLIDLSIAEPVERCSSLRSAIGTDSYMAPEQCRPGEGHPLGPPADVWGIGATMYRAVTDETPFANDFDSDDAERRWPQLVEPVPTLHGRAPDPVADIVEECMRFDPADRPTPAEVAERLEALLEDLPKLRLAKLKPRLG
jgi:eukaryotic-like serine/threonine-protein kinase